MRLKYIIWSLPLIALCVACGSKKPHPSIPPYRPLTELKGFEAAVDPEISRIYGDHSVFGRTPRGLTWSPDSKHILFMRTMDSSGEDGPSTGLWMFKIDGSREHPLVHDKNTPVDEYAWLDESNVVFGSGGELHLISLDGEQRKLLETEGAETGLQPSPDGKRVAYLRDHNIYVLDIKKGTETAVTTDGTKGRYYGDVTWVYGEEFAVETGFGWSPDSESLWLYKVDETGVTQRSVLASSDGTTRVQAYPRPGEANPVLRVGAARVPANGKDIAVKWMDTGEQNDIYLPRVAWFPDGEKLAVIRIDRLQTLLELLDCNVDGGQCKTVVEERDPRWVNLLGSPEFMDNGKDFIWLSERDGYSHIYLLGNDGLVKRQLTDGDWVVSEVNSVDEKGGWVYFTGNPEKPVHYGVFRVPLKGGKPERITGPGGVHYATFSPDSRRFTDNHTNLETPPRVDLLRVEGEDHLGQKVVTISASDLGNYSSPDVTNELIPIDSDDVRYWAQLTRPRAFEPDRKYPVLVYVYGGPGAQVVKDHFRTSFQGWRNLLAKRGILVFSMDNRGTTGRGREFEVPIHRELGKVELRDQLMGVSYLKEQPYVDPDRLAVFGWSYGGTMVLNALLETEGIFKAGVSVAPVTDWREYDSAYTERFMQRPADNEEGYERTSVVNRAAKLETPLLLVHGIADDNVHYVNSARMTDALVKEGKLFETMFYPGKKHGIRGGPWRTHLFSKITRFLEKYL